MDLDKINSKLRELNQIMQERNAQLKQLAPILGADFSFSDEEMIQDIKEKIAKYIEEEFTNYLESN